MPPSGPSEPMDSHVASVGLKNIKTSIAEPHPVPYGSEIIGNTISFFHSKRSRWSETSEIIAYEEATGKHSVRIEGSGEVQALSLAQSKFKWVHKANNAAPNPSWAGSPQGQEAVGRKVRVFWPGDDWRHVGAWIGCRMPMH